MTEETETRFERSHGKYDESDELFFAHLPNIALISAVLGIAIFASNHLGWWNFFAVLLFVGCFKLIGLLWHERDYLRSALPLFFGNYATREAAEEENRRHFEASAQPTVTLVTEEEINDVEGIMGFAEDTTTGEPLDPPPVIRWRWLGLALIWVLNLWPFYFWPRYFWQYLSQHPSEDATDRAEDWMWWIGSVTISIIMFVGWRSEGSSIPFWLVLLTYAGLGVFLWAMLTFRRNTAI